MSQSHSILTLSIKASAAISANTAVTAAGGVPAAAAAALGFARSDAASGDQVPVDVLGTTIAVASAAIAAGAAVEIASGGKVATQSSGKAVGVALEAASAAGDLIEVFLIPNA